MNCQYDSGSATGNQPVCHRPATVRATYAPYRGAITMFLCARHLESLKGATWPVEVHAEQLA